MPELPEVQTIVDDLNRKIKGDEIVGFWTDFPKSIKLSLTSFSKIINGKKIKKIRRRGKNLLFYLDNEWVMLVHLKMTGHLLVKFQNLKSQRRDYFKEKVNQRIHHIWKLKNRKSGKVDKTLEFSDLRKFAKINLIPFKDLSKAKDLKGLGVEPLSKEFSFKVLREILENKAKVSIRDILMDQKIIAGIGNIYASEILFEAGILPSRKAFQLSFNEIKKLHFSIKKILEKAIRFRGTSESDYRDTEGAPGNFQKVLKVYQLDGQACRRKGCKGVIKRERVKQRSSFYCDNCQK